MTKMFFAPRNNVKNWLYIFSWRSNLSLRRSNGLFLNEAEEPFKLLFNI